MRFVLSIELGNDAVRTRRHLADILRGVAEDYFEALPDSAVTVDEHRVRDANGNTVGTWEVTEDPQPTTATLRMENESSPFADDDDTDD